MVGVVRLLKLPHHQAGMWHYLVCVFENHTDTEVLWTWRRLMEKTRLEWKRK